MEQGRIEQVLHVGKAGQTDRPAADLLLHAGGGGQAAQGAHRGIEPAAEKETQVLRHGQRATRIGERGMQRKIPRRAFQAGAEILQQPPAGERGGIEDEIDGASHVESQSKWYGKVQGMLYMGSIDSFHPAPRPTANTTGGAHPEWAGVLTDKVIVSWQGEAVELGRRLRWEALRRGLGQAQQTLVLSDGSAGIWNLKE